MATDYQQGMYCAAYVGDADTALASLDVLSNVTDVTIDMSTGESDVTTRANLGWKATAATLKECSATFKMVYKPDDANMIKIRDAWLNGDTLAMAFLTDDRDTSGAEGPRGNFSITNFSRSEPLTEAVTYDVTAKLAAFAEWVEV
jgi:hypothetical protein